MGFLNLGTPDANFRTLDGPADERDIWQQQCKWGAYSPVCGTDGETYNNHYCASAAGVGVKHRGKCKKDGKDGVVCGKNGKWYKNAAAAKAAGTGVDPSGKACKKRACGKDGKWYKTTSDAEQKGGGVDRTGKSCKKKSEGDDGPGGGNDIFDEEADVPEFHKWLTDLPKEINSLYAEMEKQNLSDIAFTRGLYDHISPDIKNSYKLSLDQNRERLTQIGQQMGAFDSLMSESHPVIRSFLDGSVVDPVVADAINRSVGLTGSQATLSGAPIQQNSYLTQAATKAATEAAAPIRVGAMQSGVNMLGQLGNMTQQFSNLSDQQTMMPFGPQIAGLSAAAMDAQMRQQLVDQMAVPMERRLGMQTQGSNLMGNAINQILAPWMAGMGLGTMWSPYTRNTGFTTDSTTIRRPIEENEA